MISIDLSMDEALEADLRSGSSSLLADIIGILVIWLVQKRSDL